MCSTNDEDQYQDINNVSDSCDSVPSVAVDVHSTNDIKYYLLSLAMSIITMLVLKLVWKCSKLVSIGFIKTVDELNKDFVSKIIKSNTNTNATTNNITVDKSLMHDGILYRNGKLLRRNTGSNVSLRSVSLSDEISVLSAARTDSEMSKTEKGVDKETLTSPPKSPVNDQVRAYGFVITLNNKN